MKILLATKNKDKFKIISEMLKTIFKEEITFKSLNDYPDFIEEDEVGTNLERAKKKAYNAISQIDENFDIVIGIDDGIVINKEEFVAVKDHLYDIIVGDKVKIGDKIYITRAYHVVFKDKSEKYCYNMIPYIVRKKLDKIPDAGYELNSVISTTYDDKVLTEKSSDVLNEYFLEHSIENLKELFKEML